MAKKRIFIVVSCVTRDLFELTDRYEIAECVSRSSLASAFADKPFLTLGMMLSLNPVFQSNCPAPLCPL